jgi:hypothetical protein
MAGRARRRGDDLFALFPDLPRLRPRSRAEQVDRIRRQLVDTRVRAAVNIERQRRATAQVRLRVALRQVEILSRRRSIPRRRR